MREINKEIKIVSAWQTGNESSKKVRRDSRSASAQADANEENGNQTHDVGSLIMCKEREMDALCYVW
jgi:hypothetical protein